jgi:putative DNA-invertase from lambdoid prophage Rac
LDRRLAEPVRTAARCLVGAIALAVALVCPVALARRQSKPETGDRKGRHKPIPTYGYTRVSTQAQVDEGQSLDVQRRQLEGWAMMKGTELDGVFVERAISGSVVIKERPEGQRMWRLLKKRDTVVTSKLDRMFRSALDALQTVEELRVKGVALILLDLGTEPLTNGLSKTFLTIAAAFAEAERDRTGERIGQVKADQRTRGRYLGGKLPFGYSRGTDGELVEVEEQQIVIVRIKAMRAERKSLRSIQAEVAAGSGRRLSLDAISRIVAGR